VRYELKDGTANKFWDVVVAGKAVTTTYGRIGSPGQHTKKTFASPAAAQRAHDQLVTEKTRKGYKLVTAAAAAAAAAAPPPRPGQPAWDLTLAFEKGKTLRDGDTTYKVQLIDIAPLVLTTGKIIACDPFVASGARAFQRTVKKGTYPVTLSVAKIGGRGKDERVGCAVVWFAKGDPVKWEMAIKPGQALAKLKPGHSFGYGVDAGAGCFMDEAAFANLELVNSIAYANDGYEGWLLPTVQKTFFAEDWATAILEPKTKANIVLCSSGWGDGFYTSWWGLSKSGQPLCLLTDFDVYPRPESADDD
jgi:predicted DNA-binding WGR domain protein